MGILRYGSFAVFCIGLFARAVCAQTASSDPVSPAPSAMQNYARLPLAFEKQAGGSGERFVARGRGYVVGLDAGKAVIEVTSKAGTSHAVSIELAGSNPRHASPGSELPGKINRIRGNDPRQWQLGLPTYERITYPGAYPGIDVVYYGNQQQLEFDLVVKPGADPAAIRLKVEGAGALSIDGSGALNLGEAAGGLRIGLPQIYQDVNGEKKGVPGHYVIVSRDEAAFRIDPWDHTRALVIDPTIVYSALFGGYGLGVSAIGYGIGIDSSGNILIAGEAYATDFPAVNAAQNSFAGSEDENVAGDAFVTKINPAGTAFIYSTYLGGSNYQYATALAVDSTGAAWVTGLTESTDFPLLFAAQATLGDVTSNASNAFVARLNAAGVLQFSTFLGGNSISEGLGIAVDNSNSGYVTGYTQGSFPTTGGVLQTAYQGGDNAFVAKYSPSGALLYSTLLGGNSTEGYGIAVDTAGNAYVTGNSTSSAFTGAPAGGAQAANNGAGDAFVAKLNANATALLYFTFLGGTGFDEGLAIAVDSMNNAYIAGQTGSTGLATAGAAQTALAGGIDGFAAKLNPTGSAFTYVTYIGGIREDYLQGLALDGSGNVYVTGSTDSLNFPLVQPIEPMFPGYGISLINSTNSAGSWSVFDTNIAGAVFDVSINPAGTSTVVLTEGGMYRTVNGGASWTQQLALYAVGSSSYLARSPAASGTIYAGICCAGGPGTFQLMIYQSTNDGVTWTFTGNTPSQAVGSAGGLLADPLTANTLYLYVNGGASPYNLCVSKNGGATWSPAATGLPLSDSGEGVGIGTMAATSDGAIYTSPFPSGVFKSTNQGGSWTAVENGLPADQFAGPEGLSASGTTLYIAGDDGYIYKTTNGGASWAPAPVFVDATWVVASPQNPSVLYTEIGAGTNLPLSYVYGVSTDGGATWTEEAGIGLPQRLYCPKRVVDPSNSAHLMLAGCGVDYGAFVAKLNSTGSALDWSTYLGAISESVYPFAVATDGAGDAFVTGETYAGYLFSGFPVTPTALGVSPYAGTVDAFLTKISDTTAACSILVSPASAWAEGYGGTLDFSVVAPSGCAWTASTNESWASILEGALGTGSGSGASGTGSGIIAFDIPENSSGATRSATLTVGAQNIIITQPGDLCTYALDTNNYPVGAGGGQVSATLTAPAGCPWTVTMSDSWAISLTSASSGTGNATITMTLAPNLGPGPRDFTLTVAYLQLVISQSGGTAQAITFGPLTNVMYGVSPFAIGATATSGMAVSFASITPGICTVSGNTVTIVSGGICSIEANQTGGAGYAAAPTVGQSFTVSSVTASITIQTVPAGLQFTVDGGLTQTAPHTISLTQGAHTIAVMTTQAGTAGTQNVFTSWSDNGAASHSITVGATAATYTATFQTQYQLTTAASPPADGAVTPASGTFYNSGTVVPIAATANSGYTFSGWTGTVANASSASTTVTMNAPESVTGNFSSPTAITIQTVPAGRQFSINGGTAQTAPQTLNLSPGAYTIAVAVTQAGTAGTQYVFTSWSDNGAASHSITVGGTAATYTATFQTQYQLTTAASPAADGTVMPASGIFYNSGTVVPIAAASNTGYTFTSWTGTVANASTASTTVTMSGPQSVTANFQTASGIPFFNGSVSLGSGVLYLQFPDGSLFGYYTFVSANWIYHFDLGYEYVDPANDVANSVYLWDEASGHWWYTNPAQFPYLYDFTLNAWLYYYPSATAGRYTSNPRYFVNLATNQIFTM